MKNKELQNLINFALKIKKIPKKYSNKEGYLLDNKEILKIIKKEEKKKQRKPLHSS